MQYHGQPVTPVTVRVVPGTTSAAALFSSKLYCLWALLVPDPNNASGTDFLMDYLATPISNAPMSLPPLPTGGFYDLAKIRVKAGGVLDAVLVTYLPPL